MALVKTVNGKTPQFGEDCFLADNATVVGDVIMGDNCSIWFNAVVRGDVHSIRMGNKVNVQDGAIVHGCTIHDNVLVGMGAIIMDGAVINSNCMIAAGALVLEGTVVESGYL